MYYIVCSYLLTLFSAVPPALISSLWSQNRKHFIAYIVFVCCPSSQVKAQVVISCKSILS